MVPLIGLLALYDPDLDAADDRGQTPRAVAEQAGHGDAPPVLADLKRWARARSAEVTVTEADREAFKREWFRRPGLCVPPDSARRDIGPLLPLYKINTAKLKQTDPERLVPKIEFSGNFIAPALSNGAPFSVITALKIGGQFFPQGGACNAPPAADLLGVLSREAPWISAGNKLYLLSLTGTNPRAVDLVLKVDSQGHETLVDCCLQNPGLRIPTDVPILIRRLIAGDLFAEQSAPM